MINHNHNANCCNKEGFLLYSDPSMCNTNKKNIIHDVV